MESSVRVAATKNPTDIRAGVAEGRDAQERGRATTTDRIGPDVNRRHARAGRILFEGPTTQPEVRRERGASRRPINHHPVRRRRGADEQAVAGGRWPWDAWPHDEGTASNAVERADLIAARPERCEHIGDAVPSHIAGGHADAAGERVVGREEAEPLDAGGAIEHAHVRTATGIRTGDHIRVAVAIDVAGRDEHAADKACIRRERPQLRVRRTAEDPDGGAATGTAADDEVGVTIAVDVARRHTHPAAERRVGNRHAPERCPAHAADHAYDRVIHRRRPR